MKRMITKIFSGAVLLYLLSGASCESEKPPEYHRQHSEKIGSQTNDAFLISDVDEDGFVDAIYINQGGGFFVLEAFDSSDVVPTADDSADAVANNKPLRKMSELEIKIYSNSLESAADAAYIRDVKNWYYKRLFYFKKEGLLSDKIVDSLKGLKEKKLYFLSDKYN